MEGHLSRSVSQKIRESDTEVEMDDNISGRHPTPSTAKDIELLEKDAGSKTQDGDIVDWDGPDDPENPMNWSNNKKWLNVVLISALTLVT